jgi:hypothetical protein
MCSPMLTPERFKAVFVDPAVKQFAEEPSSVLHACTLIWCLDALASHVALHSSPVDLSQNPNEREKRERAFKCDLVSSGQAGSWQYHIVREASNALKHAWRKKSVLGAETSDLLFAENVDGYFWYFHGPERAPRCGQQVVVKLGLIFDDHSNKWTDTSGNRFEGPFTKWVPTIGLVAPIIELLGFNRVQTETVIGNDWQLAGHSR